MSDRLTLTTRDIGMAENALRANLSRVIASSGLDYGHWVALQMITHNRPNLTSRDITSSLAKALKVDDDTAQALLDDLVARGVLDENADTHSLSDSGSAIFNMLSNKVQEITDLVFADLDAQDLAVTHRVLLSITMRAERLLAN